MNRGAGWLLSGAGLLGGVLVIGGSYLHRGVQGALGALAGWIISIPPGLLSYRLARRAAVGPARESVRALLTGMIFRMGVFLGGLLVIMVLARSYLTTAALSGLLLYFLLLAVEVGVLYRRSVRGGEGS